MKMSQYALERDDEDHQHEGPDQEAPVVEAVASYILGLADLASIALFIGMVAVWAAVGSGKI